MPDARQTINKGHSSRKACYVARVVPPTRTASAKSFLAWRNLESLVKGDTHGMSEDLKKREPTELSKEELDALQAEGLPDRENMSLVDVDAAVPVNAAVAANVLTNRSVAGANANQHPTITQ